MNSNGTKPKSIALRANPDIAGTRFRDYQGTVEYDEAGIPIVVRLRCRSPQCCRKREGHHAYHLFTIYGVQNGVGVGQYVPVYVALRSVETLPVGALTAAGFVPGEPANQ